tara:strand:+ start:1109 stop:1468 length:360 start_codon:yes stop_codon:yes gene_type:complete
MEVVGVIKVKSETQTIGAKGFQKRELVVTTDDQYPQMIMIEFVQDKCDLLDSYKVGDNVKVSINLRGREWINPEGVAKYFNSVQGWRVEKLEGEPQEEEQQEFQRETPIDNGEPDDLPF